MGEVVFVPGAGFNRSILDPTRSNSAPLARNFFQVFMTDKTFASSLDAFRQHIYVDLLFEEIERYWHRDLDGLRTQPFDIEECLTLFESQELQTGFTRGGRIEGQERASLGRT